MTEVTISSAALVALDELKERRPASRYDADVLKELRFNGFVSDVSGGWLVISKRGLDYLCLPHTQPPRASSPAPSVTEHKGAPSKARTLPIQKRTAASHDEQSTPAHKPALNDTLSESALETLAAIAADQRLSGVSGRVIEKLLRLKLVERRSSDDKLLLTDEGRARLPPVSPSESQGEAIALDANTPQIEQVMPPDGAYAVDPVKSREDVERLKAKWAEEPHWDLEATPGYEAYYDELLAFRQQMKAEWQTQIGIRQSEWAMQHPAHTSTDAPCAGDCGSCFNRRALDYLMQTSPGIRTLVQRFRDYDQAETRLDQMARKLEGFRLE